MQIRPSVPKSECKLLQEPQDIQPASPRATWHLGYCPQLPWAFQEWHWVLCPCHPAHVLREFPQVWISRIEYHLLLVPSIKKQRKFLYICTQVWLWVLDPAISQHHNAQGSACEVSWFLLQSYLLSHKTKLTLLVAVSQQMRCQIYLGTGGDVIGFPFLRQSSCSDPNK